MREITDVKKLDAALASRRAVGLEAADLRRAIGGGAVGKPSKKMKKPR